MRIDLFTCKAICFARHSVANHPDVETFPQVRGKLSQGTAAMLYLAKKDTC